MHKHLKRIPVWLPQDVAVIYFVTCCTAARQKVLANPTAHAAIVSAWKQILDWKIGRYVVMPDHVHFFVSPKIREGDLSRFVQTFRSFVTKSLRPQGYPYPLWQREFFDRLLRREESYEEKWQYVCANPVRHGLVTDVSQWPYAGELHSLEL
jgi:REP element-mobilizing transposase RayT